MELIRIQNFEELLGDPDQHIKSMKDASDKLLQYEHQLLAADSERKKLFVQKEETSEKLLKAEAERKKLVVEKDNSAKEASEKLAQAENQFLTAQKQLYAAEAEKKQHLIEKEL